jgi:acyl carrier protein
MESTRTRGREMPVEGYVEPANDLERAVARIWGQVLGVRKVGVEHTLKEIGGNSLKNVLLLTQLKKELGINVAITDLFEYPTVRTLVKMLDAPRQGATEDKKITNGSQRGSRMRQRKAARKRGVRD